MTTQFKYIIKDVWRRDFDRGITDEVPEINAWVSMEMAYQLKRIADSLEKKKVKK